jgi:rubrerythrin
MFRKLKRRNTKKTRRLQKKQRRATKKTRRLQKNQRRVTKKTHRMQQTQRRTTKNTHKNYYGGGDWIPNKKINNNDRCSICNQIFEPNLAVYKTDCGHLFHNNCLNDKCETNRNNWYCPICGEPITEDQCTDVWAFKNKAMHERDFNDNQVKGIYINQDNIQQ